MIPISDILLKEIDEMVENGYYEDRVEAINDALDQFIKQYKLSKLKMKEEENKG
jgi:metal-responsive CopG/Arc/MetJ family transcriptional regulator